jgi:hypothetical protein
MTDGPRGGHAGRRAGEILIIDAGGPDGASVAQRVLGALAAGGTALPPDEATPDRLSDAVVVLSPAMAEGLDAVELAGRLRAGGFRGRWLAYAEDLPDRQLIVREVGEVAPDLRFDLVILGGGPRLAP